MKIASLIAAAILLFSAGKSAAQPKKNTCCDWRKVGALPGNGDPAKSKGVAGPVSGILKDKLVVAGGCYFPDLMPWEGGHKIYTNKGFVFSKDGNDLLHVEHEFTLPEPLAYPAVCLTDKGLLVAGGENEQGASQKVWLLNYDPLTATVKIDSLPNLPMTLSSASVVAFDERVFLFGGENQQETSSASLLLDLAAITRGWQKKSVLPHPLSHAVSGSIVHQGKPVIILAGGRSKNPGKLTQFYKDVHYYDYSNDQWSSAPALPYELAAGTGLPLPDGSFALFGGDRGTTFHQVETLIIELAKTTDPDKVKKLTAKKARVQSSHPGFSSEVLILNQHANRWVVAGNLTFQSVVTTTAHWWNHEIVLPAGEIRAGVRTPDIFIGTIHHDAKQ